MKRLVLSLLLAIVGGRFFAQAPEGYYDSASGKTGIELRQALHDIIDNHTTITYANVLNAFWSTDNKGNGVVWDMYSDGAYSYSFGNNCSGSCSAEQACYNREHSWPQSWFNNNDDIAKTDLHHIFPTDCYVNQRRSNYPFGEVQSATWTSQNGSKLGHCKSSLGYSDIVFEPIDEYKGDFARALMYMSVRYYGEDSNWGTSGMTNKAEILPWAMAMLLDWSENDPVSQKEIDRNNAIYTSYQHNRNPFIDHPEYARMIWDENYQGGTSYAIVCAENIPNGSVSAPTTAVEGSMVNLYATPAIGYMLDSWDVYKTETPSTKVTVTNNSFVMPSYDVTVSATFSVNTTQYNITCATGLQHGSVSANCNMALSGTTITLSNTPQNGCSLYSYYVYETGNIDNIVHSGTSNTFVMPAFDVTVSASFAQIGGNGGYVKVTSAPTDWSGEYILVYENTTTQGYVWTGVEEENCYVEKSISNNSIADDGVVSITIAQMAGGYSIKVNGGTNNGMYIYGKSGENKLLFSANASLNTLSYESNSVKITSNTSVMRFNNNSGQKRFRYFKSDTYNNQQAIQLYKKTSGSVSTPTHTIRFYPNGASGLSYTQTVNEFVPTALQANSFTRTGYAFDSWNTAANGSGTYYADQAMVTLINDLTLYAQWDPTYTITLATVENGSISTGGVTEAVEGAEVTLTATPDMGYDLEYWTVTAENEEPIEVVNNSFVMPGYAVTVSAVFVYVGQSFTQQYYLVTSTDHLVAGRTYLIVNTAAGKALSTTQTENNRGAADVVIDNDEDWLRIASIENTTACELTLGGNTGEWTFFDAVNNGFLYAASKTQNYLRTQTTLDDNGKWAITLADDGKATIQARGDNTHNLLKYNSQNPVFSCYASGYQSVYLFIKGKEFDHPQSESITRLLPFDKHTVHSGATLTVTGTASSGNVSHIILEDGAQLVHHNDGVKATMKKTVQAYTDDGGWYTIATPFATDYDPASVLTSDQNDLYAYDEDADLEWVNYKSGSFNLASGQGYLYAHNPTTTLRMGGTLNNGEYSQTVNLSYNNIDADLKGWNLLGNPTAHEIDFTKTTGVSDGYYFLNNSNGWVYEMGATVPVGRGFLVKANASGQSVSLNPQSKGYHVEKDQYLCLSIGEEKAYVKLNDGVSMPLMDLNGRHSGFFLLQEHKPYVMLVRDAADALDLCFEAHKEGIQTLKVEAQGLDLDYLHLIDHKTGADIDLLAMSSYSFEALKEDYATRFMLVFAPMEGPSTSSETFAYWTDGEIRLIAEPRGTETLQVMDLTGRMMVCSDVARNVSTANMTPGVYVLRLLTDEDVRVQKIVLK